MGKLMVESKSSGNSWPFHGWLGVVLVLVFWMLNWSLPGLRTQWAFFPLWLGYCLTVDALVYQRKGHSLLTRNPRSYIMLFVISLPAWWLFEIINWRTQNWSYNGRQFFSDLEYFAFASLSFSTVMPAVFGTAEWIGTFNWLRRIRPGLEIRPTQKVLLRFFGAGWLMLGLLFIWPQYFFPFVWISVYFILEPVNVWLKNRSLASNVVVGDWRPVLALWVGVLICGFFWEMWNFYSYPKWIYRVPFVDFWRIFEMPLLGYGGYLPFSLELAAVYHLVIGALKKESALDLVARDTCS
jgi:hypothetical protein